MEDRAAINERMKIANFFPDFFSVLLPELGRPQYLKKCIDHIHQYADMPVEIIVHDDGSGAAKQQELVSWRDQISTLILNHGHNTGLARSFNRCRAMASSPYMLGFNIDTYMTSPFLRNMKAALDLPYVGTVNVVPSIGEGPGIHVTKDGVKVALSTNFGACHAFGVRMDVWDRVGGWNEYVQTTASDGGFLGTVFGAGYFFVNVEGTVYNEMWANDGVVNKRSESNPTYVSASEFCRDDINVPPIFKMARNRHDECCKIRWHEIYREVNQYRIAALGGGPPFDSWHDSEFIHQQVVKLFRGDSVLNIDWEFAKTHGHDKWKDRIIQDFNLG